MFKFTAVLLAIIACASAKPGLIGAPLAYTAPAAVVAAPAPFVTATSSQYIARNHNGIASAPIVAPVAAPIVARSFAPIVSQYAAASPLAYTAPLSYSAPIAARYTAAAAPLAYTAPLSYQTPLSYAAASAPILF